MAKRRGIPSSTASVAAPDRSRDLEEISTLVGSLADRELEQLRLVWRNHLGGKIPAHLPRWLLTRLLAYRIQATAFGDLDKAIERRIRRPSKCAQESKPFASRAPATRDGLDLKPGSLLVREWKGQPERVMVLDDGFAWRGATYSSLSQVARAITGTSWNGHRFFGLRKAEERARKSVL